MSAAALQCGWKEDERWDQEGRWETLGSEGQQALRRQETPSAHWTPRSREAPCQQEGQRWEARVEAGASSSAGGEASAHAPASPPPPPDGAADAELIAPRWEREEAESEALCQQEEQRCEARVAAGAVIAERGCLSSGGEPTSLLHSPDGTYQYIFEECGIPTLSAPLRCAEFCAAFPPPLIHISEPTRPY